jgi:hypothetical protein
VRQSLKYKESSLNQWWYGTNGAYRSTTGELHPTDGQYPFEAWQGFQWSPDDKALLLKEIDGERFRRAVERQVSPDEECDIHLLNTINGICSVQGRCIRICMDMMLDAVKEEENLACVLLQSRSQESDPSRCFAELGGQIKVATAPFLRAGCKSASGPAYETRHELGLHG